MNHIEKYTAVVNDTRDPEGRGRILVTSIELFGNNIDVLPIWVEPLLDWGWFYVPDVGEVVEIEGIVENSQREDVRGQAILEHPNWQWRGKRHAAPDGKAPASRPTFFATNYGKRRGFYTPAGHVLFFDDTPGKEGITIGCKVGDKYSLLTFDEKGSITASGPAGTLYMNADKMQVSVADSHGNMITMKDSGIGIIDNIGHNVIELKDGVIQILAKKNVVINSGGNVTIKAKSAQVDATNVTLGAATLETERSPLVRFDEMKAYVDEHKHPLPMTGTTSAGPVTWGALMAIDPPTTQLPESAKSSTTKVK